MASIDYGAFICVIFGRKGNFRVLNSGPLFSISRMDKYYMLVRRFVNATFRLLLRAEWAESACQEYNSILSQTGGPLW